MTLREYFREHNLDEATLSGDPAVSGDTVLPAQWELEIIEVTQATTGTMLKLSDQSGVWLGKPPTEVE